MNMLRTLKGVIEGQPMPPPKQIVVMRSIKTIRPTQGGWLSRFAPPLASRSRAASCLGRVVSPYTFEDAGGDPDALQEADHDHVASLAQPRRVRRLRLHGRRLDGATD